MQLVCAFQTLLGPSTGPASAPRAVHVGKFQFRLRCGWQRDRDARAPIAKRVFGLPICLGAGELLCQIVLSIWNSFRALVLRNKAQFQELMQVD